MSELLVRQVLMLWVTIDPVGTLAIFAALTAGLSAPERRKTAIKACVYAGLILLISIVIGQILLGALGIQLVSLQVSGGIILFLFGLQMIFGNVGAESGDDRESGYDLAVFPLAIPSIASPGSIMAVIMLTDNSLHSITQQAVTALILVGILAVTCLFMLFSTAIMRVIGRNGAAILIRVMGMLLAALSIELILGALGVPGW